jgi:hypothetical protein
VWFFADFYLWLLVLLSQIGDLAALFLRHSRSVEIVAKCPIFISCVSSLRGSGADRACLVARARFKKKKPRGGGHSVKPLEGFLRRQGLIR